VAASTVTTCAMPQQRRNPQPTAAEDAETVNTPPQAPAGPDIALLQRPEGAAITEIVAETGWMAHSVRGLDLRGR